MQVIVRADDGDQIAIDADDVATEQAVIRLGFANPTFNEASEFEGVTLTTARARELAAALMTIADAIESYHTLPRDEPVLWAPTAVPVRLAGSFNVEKPSFVDPGSDLQPAPE